MPSPPEGQAGDVICRLTCKALILVLLSSSQVRLNQEEPRSTRTHEQEAQQRREVQSTAEPDNRKLRAQLVAQCRAAMRQCRLLATVKRSMQAETLAAVKEARDVYLRAAERELAASTAYETQARHNVRRIARAERRAAEAEARAAVAEDRAMLAEVRVRKAEARALAAETRATEQGGDSTYRTTCEINSHTRAAMLTVHPEKNSSSAADGKKGNTMQLQLQLQGEQVTGQAVSRESHAESRTTKEHKHVATARSRRDGHERAIAIDVCDKAAMVTAGASGNCVCEDQAEERVPGADGVDSESVALNDRVATCGKPVVTAVPRNQDAGATCIASVKHSSSAQESQDGSARTSDPSRPEEARRNTASSIQDRRDAWHRRRSAGPKARPSVARRGVARRDAGLTASEEVKNSDKRRNTTFSMMVRKRTAERIARSRIT